MSLPGGNESSSPAAADSLLGLAHVAIRLDYSATQHLLPENHTTKTPPGRTQSPPIESSSSANFFALGDDPLLNQESLDSEGLGGVGVGSGLGIDSTLSGAHHFDFEATTPTSGTVRLPGPDFDYFHESWENGVVASGSGSGQQEVEGGDVTSMDVATKRLALMKMDNEAKEALEANTRYEEEILEVMQKLATASARTQKLQLLATELAIALEVGPELKVSAPGTQVLSLPWFKHFHGKVNILSSIIRRRLDPTKGKWTPEEDELLKAAVAACGTQWKQISQRVKGRTDAQCRERWVNILDPKVLPSEKWTEEEEATLVRLRDIEKLSWSEIASAFDGKRTDNQVFFSSSIPIVPILIFLSTKCMRSYNNVMKRRANPNPVKRGRKLNPNGTISKRVRPPTVYIEGPDGKKVKRGRGRPSKAAVIAGAPTTAGKKGATASKFSAVASGSGTVVTLEGAEELVGVGTTSASGREVDNGDSVNSAPVPAEKGVDGGRPRRQRKKVVT
ncbi:hypothetical protein P7C70_g1, partial [Phenoliferia sp. Uapishka_3]